MSIRFLGLNFLLYNSEPVLARPLCPGKNPRRHRRAAGASSLRELITVMLGDRKFADSSLEQAGFELPVPVAAVSL
jgi:hypothetical protein